MTGAGNPNVPSFAKLFTGRTDAYGTGKGRWIREPVKLALYSQHVQGRGDGLGIAPLTDDGMVRFASIDLDEPDFEAAKLMMSYLPGASFLEKSRSGNAHVHVFFSEPVDAWVVRGILREATVGAGKKGVEVFPKQDKLRPGMLGNYINLPYFGDTRPVTDMYDLVAKDYVVIENMMEFVYLAEQNLNDPKKWRQRANWLGVPSPEERATTGKHEFGTQPYLHMCAEYVIENRDNNPIVPGHRAVVYFSLAKMFANCEYLDHDESFSLLSLVNDSSTDPIEESELQRIMFNAERGEFTSTGCDDPLFGPYAHPDCPIANGRTR